MKLVLLKRKEPFYTVFTETNSYVTTKESRDICIFLSANLYRVMCLWLQSVVVILLTIFRNLFLNSRSVDELRNLGKSQVFCYASSYGYLDRRSMADSYYS